MKKYIFIFYILFSFFNVFAQESHYKNLSKIEMDVLRNDKVIGYSNYFFKRGKDTMTVENDTKFIVEMFGVKVFSIDSKSKEIYQKDNRLQCIIGDGTGSKKYIERLRTLIPNLIVAQERNSTYRAKERYFEIYPLLGLKKFLPREIFILNKNLDALAALIIIEDYHKCKFEISNKVSTKTWLK